MGWWWSSGSGQNEPQSPSLSSPPNAAATASSRPEESRASAGLSQRKPMMADDQADAELQAFLSGLKDIDDSSRPFKPPRSMGLREEPPSPSPLVEQSTAEKPPEPTADSIAPESLYPTTMSCRQAFDHAFFCQSFGGQFVNVYRYGELRECSEQWSDFWFCMRTRSYPDDEKKKMIADRYRQKAIKYKTGPSSEDVWDLRREPLKGAFEGDFLAVEREMKLAEQRERDMAEKA